MIMNEKNHNMAEKRVGQKAARRSKKNRPKVRVSGGGVKKLQQLIIRKGK